MLGPAMRRVIDLEGCLNFRDLGGYPTADGRTVRWQQVYRSDALHHLTLSSLAFYYLMTNLAPPDDPQPEWSRERLRYLSRDQMDVIDAFLQLVIEQDEFRLAFGDLESGRRRLEAIWAERWVT